MLPQVTTSVHQSEGWICSAFGGTWLTCRLLLPEQPESVSITITQQLCVFVEDYIFQRTPGGGEESSVTNYEGAHSRVQKAEAFTLSDPAVWENQPTQYGATWLTVLLSSPQYTLSFSLSPLSLSA